MQAPKVTADNFSTAPSPSTCAHMQAGTMDSINEQFNFVTNQTYWQLSVTYHQHFISARKVDRQGLPVAGTVSKYTCLEVILICIS